MRSEAALGSGDHVAGLEHAEQALQHAVADSSERAQALTQQSTHQWRLGRFEDAVESGRAGAVGTPGQRRSTAHAAAACASQAQARLMINRVEVEHQLALAERARSTSR